jgi:hypothetical protein
MVADNRRKAGRFEYGPVGELTNMSDCYTKCYNKEMKENGVETLAESNCLYLKGGGKSRKSRRGKSRRGKSRRGKSRRGKRRLRHSMKR